MPKAKATILERAWCSGCNMDVATVREYHPFAVCELFSKLKNRGQVVENIKAVIEYGMSAERNGVSLNDAFADFNNVLKQPCTEQAK